MPRVEFSPEHLSPTELLALTLSNLANHSKASPASKVWYLSCPVSSAGAARPYLHHPDEYEKMVSKIVSDNTVLAGNLAKALQLQGHFGEADVVIVPPDLGRRRHPDGSFWNELDYNAFWLMFFGQLNPELAAAFWASVEGSRLRSLFEVKEVASRQSGYEGLKALFNDLNLCMCSRPLTVSIVATPDTEYSLGAQLELWLARQLGIQAYQMVINTAVAVSSATEEIWRLLLNETWMKLLYGGGYPLPNKPGSEFKLPVVVEAEGVEVLDTGTLQIPPVLQLRPLANPG